MQTSRFQLGLIATLAVGLGFSLSSSEAVGYPAGAAVSLGINPVFSVGGTGISSGGASTIVTAPATQDMIVTDVLLQSYTTSGCKRAHRSALSIGGTLVGDFETSSAFGGSGYHDSMTDGGSQVSQSFGSGIRVQAGETLQISVSQTWDFTRTGCSAEVNGGVRYTISGYYAQP
jgi:hypothetical protein